MMRVLAYLPQFIAGVITIPVTFETIGRGSLFFSMLVVILIAAAGAGISWKIGDVRAWVCGAIFALGVVLAEGWSFLSWTFQHSGVEDVEAGLMIAVVKSLIISLLGFISALSACMLLQRYR